MVEDGETPKIATHLVDEELRLPSSFRQLCESVTYSNEEIGRIVRCLALGTEAFITPRIEPDVSHYNIVLKKRAELKARVRKSRQAKGLAEGDKPKKINTPKQKPKADEPEKPVEVKPVEPPVVVDPPKPVFKPTFIQQQIAVVPVQPKTKAVKMANKLSGDLFGLMGVQDAPKRQLLPLTAPAAVEATNHTVDTRHDSAWIPEKFAIFWKQYPRKVAKGDAIKAFTKLIKKQVDVERFMRITLASLEWWKKQDNWVKYQGKFIPYPASWLNGGHWEDYEENKDVQIPGRTGQAEFLQGDAESDDELIKRMQGG